MSFDLVCFSHLRWDFVYQRPQHLLSRCARDRRVFFVEEPSFEEGAARLDVTQPQANIWVVRPYLPEGLVLEHQEVLQRALLSEFFTARGIDDYVLWYYTPMALGFSRHLVPVATVYDCMDELAQFAGAPRILRERERELFKRADLVFTGGQSLYEAKRSQHRNVYAFPSSVDAEHFGRARTPMEDPKDQCTVPHPRMGFYGVIDERLDLDLIAGIADSRPDWHLVLVGPVVKIDPASLPHRQNIHYLGSKNYAALPAYLAGWDVALMPFARNEATQFISPTKTLEYLAGGKPVVSTAITDVVTPYGRQGLVRIADTAEEFVSAIEAALNDDAEARLPAVDAFLKTTSWHRTWKRMEALVQAVVDVREERVLSLPLSAAKAAAGKPPVKSNYGRLLPFPVAARATVTLGRSEGAE